MERRIYNLTFEIFQKIKIEMFNSMQRHYNEQTVPAIVREQEATYKVSHYGFIQ